MISHVPATRKESSLALSRQELALVAVTVVWGGTFLAVHTAMQYSGPLFFVGMRFVTAGVLALVLFRKSMAGLTRRELAAGFCVGVTIFLGYALQSFGLQTISSSKSAFITALYVPIVPLLEWVVLRRRPRAMSLVGIGLAFAGLVLLAGPEAGQVSLGRGEVVTLVGAVAIAAEILLIGRFAGQTDSRRITVVQLLTGGLLSLLFMPVAGEAVPAFSWGWAGLALALGVASALIQLTMNWAQKTVSPTRATVIYASEPVWAGVVGRLAGERLPGIAVVGAALIVVGVLASELKGWPLRRRPAAGRRVPVAEGSPAGRTAAGQTRVPIL